MKYVQRYRCNKYFIAQASLLLYFSCHVSYFYSPQKCEFHRDCVPVVAVLQVSYLPSSLLHMSKGIMWNDARFPALDIRILNNMSSQT